MKSWIYVLLPKRHNVSIREWIAKNHHISLQGRSRFSFKECNIYWTRCNVSKWESTSKFPCSPNVKRFMDLTHVICQSRCAPCSHISIILKRGKAGIELLHSPTTAFFWIIPLKLGEKWMHHFSTCLTEQKHDMTHNRPSVISARCMHTNVRALFYTKSSHWRKLSSFFLSFTHIAVQINILMFLITN